MQDLFCVHLNVFLFSCINVFIFLLYQSNATFSHFIFLQENGRAKLVGEKTFGKGVIQNLQELRQGGIAVTIAKYETPLHNNINKVLQGCSEFDVFHICDRRL
jgi:Peptidase family S41